MKLGCFAALCCAIIALIGAVLVYWDLQDGYFNTKVLALPIITGTLAVTLLLFPGGSTTFKQAALDDDSQGVARWSSAVPRSHSRAWVLTLGLSAYLTMGAEQYLQGEVFLRWVISSQLWRLLCWHCCSCAGGFGAEDRYITLPSTPPFQFRCAPLWPGYAGPEGSWR